MKLHHVGIATDNIDELIKFLEKVTVIVDRTDKIYDPLQDAWLCMLELAGSGRLELIEGNAVKRFVKKHMNLYHTCYEVEDIRLEKEKWITNGAVLVSDEKEAILFDNRKVVFLMSQIGMVELLESGGKDGK